MRPKAQQNSRSCRDGVSLSILSFCVSKSAALLLWGLLPLRTATRS